MNTHTDSLNRSPTPSNSPSRWEGEKEKKSFLLAMTTGVVARELLPVLLLLYPLLLLLDDLEPGFVRSVVNPHWFLLAIIVVGMISGRIEPSPSSSPSRWEGEKLRVILALVTAIIAGLWVWWRVGGGKIGVVVAVLAALAIAVVVWSFGSGTQSEDR